MSRVAIALAHIHNHNAERNDRLLPSLAAFAADLAVDFDVERFSIAHQPQPLPPLSPLQSLRRDLRNEVIGRAWARYRDIPTPGVKTYLHVLKRLLLRYVFDRAGEGARRRRVGAIEIVLTDKHLRAWDRFLDSDADLMIVFEDDAFFGDASVAHLRLALRTAQSLGAERPLYADLAAGAALGRLRVDKLMARREQPLLFFSRPVTNCTGAYLVNRPAVSAFRALVLANPLYRLISADWLLDQLFMDLEAARVPMNCFHFDPPALIHGSSDGGLGSTIR